MTFFKSSTFFETIEVADCMFAVRSKSSMASVRSIGSSFVPVCFFFLVCGARRSGVPAWLGEFAGSAAPVIREYAGG